MQWIFLLLVIGSSFARAEPSFSPIFPDSPHPFGERDFRPGAWSTFPPTPSPYYRSGQAPQSPNGWEIGRTPFFNSPFEHAFRLEGSIFPSQSGLYLRPIGPKADLIKDIGLDPKKVVATVSLNCKKGTMNNASYNFLNTYRFGKVYRHSTVDEIYRVIGAIPEGTETFVLAAHGNVGSISAFTIENVAELGKRLREKGIKKIVLGSCSAAWGPEGERFISELARTSQAEVYAWDQPVYMNGGKTYLEHGGHLVIALPEPQENETGDGRLQETEESSVFRRPEQFR